MSPTTPTPTSFRYEEPVQEWQQIGYIVLSVVYGVIATSMVIVMWIRRTTRVFSARSPGILAFAIFYGVYTVAICCASYIIGKPDWMCEVLSYSFTLFLPFFCVPYLLMFPTIVFADQLNSLKVDRANGGRNWRWRLKVLFTTKSKTAFIFLAAVIQLATYLALRYTGVVLKGGEEGLSPLGEEKNCYRIALLVNSVFVLFYFAVLGSFSLQALRIADPFFVRNEVTLVTLTLTPLIMITVIYPIAPQIFPLTFDYRWVPITVTLSGFVIGVLGTVLVSFDRIAFVVDRLEYRLFHCCRKAPDSIHEMDTDAEATVFALSQGVDVFDAVLDSDILRGAFTDYLVGNWSVENVLFYESVKHYKLAYDTASPETSLQSAKTILSEFVVNGAPLEINIEYLSRMATVKAVQSGKITKEIYNAPQKHIYELMKKDSFEKFRKTAGYREAVGVVMRARRSSRSFERSTSVLLA